MRVLALNPFHSGSHRAFLEGWARHSQHEFTILSLPGRKWKWRMRHAPLELARQITAAERDSFDCMVSTDMLDLPTLRGLCPRLAQLPCAIYFHENQLTYPVQSADGPALRDLHYAFTNLLTAHSAEGVWFNSDWHRTSFLSAAAAWARRLPDFRPVELVEAIASRAVTLPPGVDLIAGPPARLPGPLRIVWVSRWEFDKNPETFFSALRLLRRQGVMFRLSVLGEAYAEAPDCFAEAATEFADCIDRWGFAQTRADYEATLTAADVVVSTAVHEFFGLGVVEAVSAGCQPVVPAALAYPEVLSEISDAFHDNTPEDVCRVLVRWARAIEAGHPPDRAALARGVHRYRWNIAGTLLDEHLMLTAGNR